MADISMKSPDSRDDSKVLLEMWVFPRDFGCTRSRGKKTGIILPGTTLLDYGQCYDALDTDNTISDDWESLMTEVGRNSSETCKDEEIDCNSDTTSDDQSPAKQCLTLHTAWLHSTLVDYSHATMLNLFA
ncbi:hypothetical protein CHS0354_036329 [Potamilus streckersoni]|uniref:Uncharacterized protein n=1 Tax=Potamilus streckersoni TaxID=2493646 RepID=A0AAE0RMI6_9BIVA|nr:hypothetical protein CHS0354_036329 [Potamilus streckersoni]